MTQVDRESASKPAHGETVDDINTQEGTPPPTPLRVRTLIRVTGRTQFSWCVASYPGENEA